MNTPAEVAQVEAFLARTNLRGAYRERLRAALLADLRKQRR